MNHSEKVAADKTSLGFEYQDLVYIEKLIDLKQGQTLGLEFHDDIHVQTADGDGYIEDLLLVQVKHSLNSGNISDRDIDLWKTFDNWLKIILDLPPHRKVSFQLYTNKGLNDQTLVSLLKEPYKNIKQIIDFIRTIDREITAAEALKKPGKAPNPIAEYVKSVSGATDQQIAFLLERFEFHSDRSSIISRISFALQRLAIPESRLDETRAQVIGAFKESKFSKITKGEKVLISFDDFRIKMGFNRIVIAARPDPADFGRFVDIYYNYQRPDSLSFSTSRFHSQLKDIGISDDEIIERGVEMMLAEQFIESLKDSGFSASENSRLENSAVSDWQLLHSRSHRKTIEHDEASHLNASMDCYDQTMYSSLKTGEIELPKNLSCGKYIGLSNLPRIGWRKNWQSKFKK